MALINAALRLQDTIGRFGLPEEGCVPAKAAAE